MSGSLFAQCGSEKSNWNLSATILYAYNTSIILHITNNIMLVYCSELYYIKWAIRFHSEALSKGGEKQQELDS